MRQIHYCGAIVLLLCLLALSGCRSGIPASSATVLLSTPVPPSGPVSTPAPATSVTPLVSVTTPTVSPTPTPSLRPTTVWPQATRTAPPSVPTYPRVVADTLATTRDDVWIRDITFVTTDPPELVHAFYRQQLTPTNGWVLSPRTGEPPLSRYANRAACPIYSLDVETALEAAKGTRVDLRLKRELCEDL